MGIGANLLCIKKLLQVFCKSGGVVALCWCDQQVPGTPPRPSGRLGGKTNSRTQAVGRYATRADTGPRKTMKLYISDGTVWENAVAVVWEDLNAERPGYFRAFWTDSPDGKVGCPVVGYCSKGGSHRTIRQVVAEFKRLHPAEPIFRNGKRLA